MTKPNIDPDLRSLAWMALAAVAILAYHILPVLLFPGE